MPTKCEPKIDDRSLRLQFKGGRCLKCDKSVKSVERRYLTARGCFEFNHVDPAKKDPGYDNLIRRKISSAQLDELDKCILLCRECHTIFHSQKIAGRVTHRVRLGNGQVKRQTIHYKCIFDYKKNHLYLFTDERFLLDVFECRLGNGKPVARVARDLVKSIGRLLLATRRRRTLVIRDAKGSVVMRATKINDADFRVEQLVRFSLFKAELKTNDPANPTIWSRNGVVILRNEGVKKGGCITFVGPYSGINIQGGE